MRVLNSRPGGGQHLVHGQQVTGKCLAYARQVGLIVDVARPAARRGPA